VTKILVIEDEESVRENILEILGFEGFEVRGAANGREGVAVAEEFLPDLIVCDIAMPEMDGYSVLLTIRQMASLASVPFIFLTARTDRSFMRHGMELGADDYLTKPFSSAELLAAIAARLERREVTARAIEGSIEEAKRRLVQMIAHELRTPLVSIEMALDIISRQVGQLEPHQLLELLDYIGRGSNRLHHVVEQMVLITQLEAGLLTAEVLREQGMPVHVSELLIAAVSLGRRFAPRSAEVAARIDERDEDLTVWGDINALKHALAEIIANALNFSPTGAEVVVSAWQSGRRVIISVTDHGPGIPAQQLAQALREFYQIDRDRQEQQGMGMGLPLARRLVEVHGGALDIQSVVGRGTQVIVELPLAQE
jgi:signal transduction histidine kinase